MCPTSSIDWSVSFVADVSLHDDDGGTIVSAQHFIFKRQWTECPKLQGRCNQDMSNFYLAVYNHLKSMASTGSLHRLGRSALYIKVSVSHVHGS